MDSIKSHLAELFGVVALETSDESDGKVAKKGSTEAQCTTLGRKALEKGRALEAVAHFERAIELAKTPSVQLWLQLAAAHESAGDDEAAGAVLTQAREKFAEETEPTVGYAETLKRGGQFRLAVEVLESAINAEPSNPLYRFKLAEACRDNKLYSDALRSAERAALCAPDQAFFHFYLGDLLIEMKRFEDALEAFRMALDLSPGDDHYLLRASVAFFGAGRHADAIRAVRMASEIEPNNNVHRLVENLYRRASGQTEEPISFEPDRYDVDRRDRIAAELGLSEPEDSSESAP